MLGKMHAAVCLVMIAQIYGFQDFVGDDKCRPLNEHPSLRAHESSTPKKVLILTPLKNAGHALHDFAKALQSLTYPKEHMSIAFLNSDSVDNTAEVVRTLQQTTLRDFAKVQMFEHNFHYEAPEDRHAFAVQAARRSILAKSRNVLIQKALTDDTFAVLWLDVDITGYPTSLVEDLLAMGRPVVAPHVLIGPITYDKNSWRETKPEEAFKAGGPEVVFEGYQETALAGGERIYMDDLRDAALAKGVEKNHRYAVCIDGVGTAVLLVHARVHREGVLFPEKPYKKRLESEGFGLWAKDRGFQPCGLPFYPVYHYDEWNTDVDVRHLQANGTRPEKPAAPVCQSWCKDHEADWKQKCRFKNCKGCKACSKGSSGEWPAPSPPKGNASRPLKMVCKGKAECKGKEMNVCLRLEKEGTCEWGPLVEVGGKGECDGAAECAGKNQLQCKQLQREGKCKWKILSAKDLVPGECVGKRGQAECDDKDKTTCKQLQKERKCKWLPAPSERRTPTGTCMGPAECENKPRRVCHRLRLQEGKNCRYKPAPENEVKVGMTIKNVKLSKMDDAAKKELKGKVATKIAETADVDEYAVEVTLSEGSVKVDATIDMEEQIGLMEAENEGTGVNLVIAMEAIKNGVQAQVGSSDTAAAILETANEVEGVKDAAEGEITISAPTTEIVAEAATKAPGSPWSQKPSPSPPSLAPTSSTTSEPDVADIPVSASVHANAFASLVIGAVAAVMMQ